MTLETFNLDGPTASPDQLEHVTWWMDWTLRFAAAAVLCAGLAHSTVVPPVVLAFTSSASHNFAISAFFTACCAVYTFRQIDRATRERTRERRR